MYLLKPHTSPPKLTVKEEKNNKLRYICYCKFGICTDNILKQIVRSKAVEMDFWMIKKNTFGMRFK